jgi:hypothetical protein
MGTGEDRLLCRVAQDSEPPGGSKGTGDGGAQAVAFFRAYFTYGTITSFLYWPVPS